jgi:hypothetical protein
MSREIRMSRVYIVTDEDIREHAESLNYDENDKSEGWEDRVAEYIAKSWFAEELYYRDINENSFDVNIVK